MTDMREKCPHALRIEPAGQVGNHVFEIDLRLGFCFMAKQEEIAPRIMTHSIRAMGFREAASVAEALKSAALAMRDIHTCEISRIQNIGLS